MRSVLSSYSNAQSVLEEPGNSVDDGPFLLPNLCFLLEVVGVFDQLILFEVSSDEGQPKSEMNCLSITSYLAGNTVC